MIKVPLIEIREIESFQEFNACIRLQKEVFRFDDLEVSPARHLVVSRHAGGFTLGAFDRTQLVGMALTVPAFRGQERIFYSHMACVKNTYQSHGIGAKLKWAQRERALADGVKFMKWTFQPVQARNAFFNLEKLGAVVRRYLPNYYGTGFSNSGSDVPLESDRLFAEWELESEKVKKLSFGETFAESGESNCAIRVPNDWDELLSADPGSASDEQFRIRGEFQQAFAAGLVCRGFERDPAAPRYLLFQDE